MMTEIGASLVGQYTLNLERNDEIIRSWRLAKKCSNIDGER